MDVTSLLNSSSAARRAAEESVSQTPTPSTGDGVSVCSPAAKTPSSEDVSSRRSSETKTPSRGRTPWDAGGYSLPLTLDTKTTQAFTKPITQTQSPLDSASPRSPRHKFSDSHSSFSSYASSANSVTHSRFSSLSTVSGFQSTPLIFTDMSALDSRLCENLDSAISRSPRTDGARRIRRDGVLSPTTIFEEPYHLEGGRPGSPSDAMLMAKAAGQDQDGVSPSELRVPRDDNRDLNLLAPPEFSRSHKRAVSAPDLAALDAIDQASLHSEMPPSSGAALAAPPTPPQSRQRGHQSQSHPQSQYTSRPPGTMEAPTGSGAPATSTSSTRTTTAGEPAVPAATPEATDLDAEDGPKCLYVADCTTGSQLRKAISHIFGRNKLCTRMIPQHVWVHYCRKHYQRCRYRNSLEWTKVQLNLVQLQIDRVDSWSDQNKTANRPGVIEEWSLAVRKREQKRLDDRKQVGSKRRVIADSDDDGEDDATLNGTAVPEWLLAKCKGGYSTDEMRNIVAQLSAAIESGEMTQIPDIEILPSITTDNAEGGTTTSAPVKRKSRSATPHARSRSVGAATHTPLTAGRRIGQLGNPGDMFQDNSLALSRSQKRQRIHDMPPLGEGLAYGERFHPAERMTMRSIHNLPHRPGFASYRDSHPRSVFYEPLATQPGVALYGNNNIGGPLPAPTPQRIVSRISAAELESGNSAQDFLDMRRPTHQRSHSEFGTNYHNSPFNFRGPPSAMAYPTVASGYASGPSAYEEMYLPPRPEPAYAAYGTQGYFDESPAARQWAAQSGWPVESPANPGQYQQQPRHMRHQSSPGAHNGVTRHSLSEAEMYSPQQRLGPAFEPQPQPQPLYHRRQQPFAGQGVDYHEADSLDPNAKSFYGAERR